MEAIEEQDGRYVLGVQWHAETLVADAEQLSLFQRLVDATRHPGAYIADEHAVLGVANVDAGRIEPDADRPIAAVRSGSGTGVPCSASVAAPVAKGATVGS